MEAEFPKICDVILALMDEPHPNGQKDCRNRRPSAKDAQEIIQFGQVDFEQVAEKRQAASQAKNDANLAKQSGVSKNIQHNVK